MTEPEPEPSPGSWKRFLKGLWYVSLGLVALFIYVAFEGSRDSFHIGLGVVFAGVVLKELFQNWIREVIRAELQRDRERSYEDSQRLRWLVGQLQNRNRQ